MEDTLGLAERKPKDLIEVLQDMQEKNGYLPEVVVTPTLCASVLPAIVLRFSKKVLS